LAATSLFVVFGFVDVAALLIQALMQVDALIASQGAIGLVLLFGLPNLTTPLPQLLRLVVRQLTGLHPIDDPTGLIRLPLIHPRITVDDRCRHGAILSVVLLAVDVPAGLVLLVMQIDPLGTGQLAIRFISPLELPNVTLALGQIPSLTPRQLPGADTLSYALLLMLLPSVHAGIPNAGLGLTQSCDTHDPGDHERQSEATVCDVEDTHTTVLLVMVQIGGPGVQRRSALVVDWLAKGVGGSRRREVTEAASRATFVAATALYER
jgi:hypothetical protein